MGDLLNLTAETWTLLLLLMGLVVVYGYWPYGVFKKLGIPGPTPTPFFGAMLGYKRSGHVFDMECFRKYGKIWGLYDGRQPVLVITDKTLIKSILIKQCYSLFTNRQKLPLNGRLHDALSFAEDHDWRRIRSILSPYFTSGRFKEMFGIMKRHSNSLVKSLQKKADKGEPADMKEFFGAYSMDTVTSTAFSVDMDSLNNPKDPFVANIKKMVTFNFFRPVLFIIVFFPFLEPLLEKMNFSFFPSSIVDFFFASVQKMKAEHFAKDRKNRVDFLQLMVESQKSEKNRDKTEDKDKVSAGLTDHEILSQAMTFIFAGYEPTSSTLSFLFYNLATNPHTMRKLQQEIDHVFPNQDPVQYNKMMQMEYLDAVLNESLRLYPIGTRLDRVCKKSVEINGVTIRKGTVVMIPTFVLHRDPEFWPDPDRFDPDRFSKDNKDKVDPYVYMPFGAGPRNCIGMRFVLVTMKLAIIEILQRFDVNVCAETEIPLQLINQGSLAPKNPVKLKLTPRTFSPSKDSYNNNLLEP